MNRYFVKDPIGIYIDNNGMVNEFFGDTQNHKAEQKTDFVVVNVLEKQATEEFEIIESYVLYKTIKSIREIL